MKVSSVLSIVNQKKVNVMRVICIDNSDMGLGKCPELTEGAEYTAIQCDVYPQNYQLLEVLFDPADGISVSYNKCRFIPLSEIDEKDLVNKKIFSDNTISNV